MHTRRRNVSGFTLLEVMVYITLVSVLCTVVWTSVLYEMKSLDDSTEAAKLSSTQEFIRNKLSVALLGAVDVYTSAHAIGFRKSELHEDSPLLFSLEHNTLTLSRGVASAVPLTNVGDVQIIPGVQPFMYDSATGQLTVQVALRGKEIKIVVYK